MTLTMPKITSNIASGRFFGSAYDFMRDRLRPAEQNDERVNPSQSDLVAMDRARYASILNEELGLGGLTSSEQNDMDTLARVRDALYTVD